MTRLRGHERAAALILAMTALVILGALGAALGSSVLRGMAATREACARDELLNAAESGVDLALSALAHDPTWAGADSAAVPGGRCAVSVRRLDDGAIEITSRAIAEPRPGRRSGVVVEARRTATSRFALAAWRRTR